MSDESFAEESKRLRFKVVLLGDEAVGKTALVQRAVYSQFTAAGDRHRPTLGVEFHQAEVTLESDVHVSLQLWDVGSQVKSLQMATNYLHGADAVLVVFDVAQQETYVAARQWVDVVQQMFQATGPPLVALVANKADTPELQAAAAQLPAPAADSCGGVCSRPYCVSAKTGHNVQALYQAVASQLAGIPAQQEEQAKVEEAQNDAQGSAEPGPEQASEPHAACCSRRCSCCWWLWLALLGRSS